MLVQTRNRVRVGETTETPGYVWPSTAIGLMSIGAVFAYVLASASEPTNQGEWNDRYGRRRVKR